MIPASSVFQVGHKRDRSESVFSIFVEICKVYVGKMIIKAAKRIFNSVKICRSYSDLNFGVTFLEHSVVYTCILTVNTEELPINCPETDEN